MGTGAGGATDAPREPRPIVAIESIGRLDHADEIPMPGKRHDRPNDTTVTWAKRGLVSGQVRELCGLVIRWGPLIGGIMWIRNSLLFNWLDRNLEKPDNSPPGYQGN